MTKILVLWSINILLSACLATSPIPYPYSHDANLSKSTPKVTDLNYRLPEQGIIISNYKLELTPHFEGEKAFTFDGKVTITAKTTENDVDKIFT